MTKTGVYSLTSGMRRIDIGTLEKGTVLWFKGYGKDGEKWVVSGRESESQYTNGEFEIIHIEKATINYVYPGAVSEWYTSNGIGYYFPPEPETITDEQIESLIVKSGEVIKERNKRMAEEQRESEERTAKAKAWFKANRPSWAKAAIIARLEKDVSDGMSDYFNSVTEKTILLAWSKHTRDNFQEMRKAAANAEETKHFYEQPEDSDERREKYSMGRGYYLGKSRYSGWQIHKISIGEHSYLNCVANPENVRIPKEKAPVKLNTTGEGIEIADYSEKAFVVRGDTRPMKDILKGIGGKFNKFLKDANGNQFAGWIFSKSRIEEVKQALIGYL